MGQFGSISTTSERFDFLVIGIFWKRGKKGIENRKSREKSCLNKSKSKLSTVVGEVMDRVFGNCQKPSRHLFLRRMFLALWVEEHHLRSNSMVRKSTQSWKLPNFQIMKKWFKSSPNFSKDPPHPLAQHQCKK